jgi:signal transduction histidine kinase
MKFARPGVAGTGGKEAAVMNPAKTLQARLSLMSVLLFVLIAGFALFTIHLFNGFNELSDDLRQLWLPSTRVLGDLNNDTSDYRTAESDSLLASDATERAAQLAIIEALGRSVQKSEQAYLRIHQAHSESALYAAFAQRWDAYRAMAAQVLRLEAEGQGPEATILYRTGSRAAYNAASDALGALTARDVQQARDASARTGRAYREGRSLIFLALLLSGALLSAALIYIRRGISNPLTKLAQAMRLLAANTTDIGLKGADRDDEIGEMARAVTVFRANAIELIQSQRGLAQQAAMLEQKLAYEQQLTRLQRNFVSMISHEFRTPLTAIDAHAQRLVNMRAHIGPEDIADRAGRVRAAVQRITSLMDNLLNSTRLMDGETTLFLHRTELDLAALLHDVCSFHRETAPAAYIGEDFGHGDLRIKGDRELLFQMFSNLLSNAIKYSPGDVLVRLRARREQDDIVVTIQDHGLGIPAADQEHLFTRYFRGGNVAGMVGTGVGLYLAKTVIQLHDGVIAVNSEEGKGACFTVRLPCDAALAAGKAPAASLLTP